MYPRFFLCFSDSAFFRSLPVLSLSAWKFPENRVWFLWISNKRNPLGRDDENGGCVSVIQKLPPYIQRATSILKHRRISMSKPCCGSMVNSTRLSLVIEF